jgi:hypothetical protein
MNKSRSKLLTVAEAVEARHGFSGARGGTLQKAACGVSASFIKKDIPPSRRTCRRVFVKDRRAVRDKDRMMIIRRRVNETIRKRFVIVIFTD